MVLVVVLVVISLLSLAALTFSQLMLAEHEAAELAGRQIQARALAESGQEAIRVFLGTDPQEQIESGGWYDNPDVFQGVLVLDTNNPYKRGRFTVISPALENGLPNGIRYGLEDESARLNLNILLQADESAGTGQNTETEATVGGGMSAGADESTGTSARDILMGLPGMTEEIADSILDWMDSDDTPREFGAEADSYSSLEPPYGPKNGPLDSIEELLLVQGVTPGLLFGADANRNGNIDAGEPDPQSLGDVDNSDGSMNGGWASLLTLRSAESNTKPDGSEKIDLNQTDMQQLYDQLKEVLSEDEATYIVAYRLNGPDTTQQPPTDPKPSGSIDLSNAQPQQEIQTVLDLVGGKTQAMFQGQNRPVVLGSPFSDDPGAMSSYLPELMENVKGKEFQGRININQAPRAVLNCIPGITSDVVDQILSRRQPDPVAAQSDPTLEVEAWPLIDGIVTLDQMKEMMPYVTTGGSIYRAQVVGYFEKGGPAVRIEVVFDATKSPPAVVSWREISNLGRGYSLDVLGRETSGLGPGE